MLVHKFFRFYHIEEELPVFRWTGGWLTEDFENRNGWVKSE